ncbi:MAG: hypothetical protein JXX29_15765 [Deltaproteobacteria bacterium]|nr:hypothetical protein [Deltaproteobacteria bacterium]MBN2673138.1 hypothetical protein [Deltaproteobacteria bacterium]
MKKTQMFEENEILTFILGCVALLIIFPVSKKIRIPGMTEFRISIVFLTVSYFFTNLEGVYQHDLCNVLEHFFFAVSGAVFLLAVHRLHKGVSTK